MKDSILSKINNNKLFENYDKIGKSDIHITYYFKKYKDFLKALEQAERDNRNVNAYSYTAKAKTIDDLQDYFCITIHT